MALCVCVCVELCTFSIIKGKSIRIFTISVKSYVQDTIEYTEFIPCFVCVYFFPS